MSVKAKREIVVDCESGDGSGVLISPDDYEGKPALRITPLKSSALYVLRHDVSALIDALVELRDELHEQGIDL